MAERHSYLTVKAKVMWLKYQIIKCSLLKKKTSFIIHVMTVRINCLFNCLNNKANSVPWLELDWLAISITPSP